MHGGYGMFGGMGFMGLLLVGLVIYLFINALDDNRNRNQSNEPGTTIKQVIDYSFNQMFPDISTIFQSNFDLILYPFSSRRSTFGLKITQFGQKTETEQEKTKEY